LKRRVFIGLVEVVEVGPMMTTEAPDVLGMLDMLSLVEIHTVIHDMPIRARAMLDQEVVEAAQLDRRMDRGTNVLRKGRTLVRIRIVVWGPRQVMRSASRR
jgi:hypothetical protein